MRKWLTLKRVSPPPPPNNVEIQNQLNNASSNVSDNLEENEDSAGFLNKLVELIKEHIVFRSNISSSSSGTQDKPPTMPPFEVKLQPPPNPPSVSTPFMSDSNSPMPPMPPLGDGHSFGISDNSKAKEMAECFLAIQIELNNRMRKSLLKKDPSLSENQVVCSKIKWGAGSGIWYENYPTTGECFVSKDGRLALSSMSVSLAVKDISEPLKDAKLKQCRTYLADLQKGKNPLIPILAKVNKPAPKPIDPKAQAMAQCLSNIQSALNEREKKALLAAIGSKPAYILCHGDYFPANSNVWEQEYPTGFCYDTTDSSPKKGFSLPAQKIKENRLYSEEEKDRRLKKCQQYLAKLNQKANFMPELKAEFMSGQAVSGQR